MTPLPEGGFGEAYGPISVLRYVVYTLCALHVAVGVLIMVVYK